MKTAETSPLPFKRQDKAAGLFFETGLSVFFVALIVISVLILAGA
jgi:hypothetical protein